MRRAGWFLAIAVAIAAAACGSDPGGPRLLGPVDGGGDDQGGPIDGGTGSGSDAGVDTPSDPGNTDLATACGGTAPMTLDDWENCYQKRTCEWELGCRTLDSFRNVADCIANGDAASGGQLAAERRERKRAIAEGRAAINVAAFTQCVLHTNPTRCDTALFDPACLTRFTGTIADGAACLTSVDCASPDAECVSSCDDACCLGTCRRKFRVGETCDNFDSCEPALRCAVITVPPPQKTIFKCVTGDIGTSCQAGSVNQCDFGAFCDSTTLRCTPTLAPGAACTRLVQCGGDETCVGLSVTSSNPGHCARISQPGDRCDGADLCFGNLYCDTAGICRSLPILGQQCSTLIPCAGANTICNSGLCALRADVGVSCAGQTCLPGLFCTSDVGDASPVCAARRDVSGACGDPTDCQSFLCSGTLGQPGVCLPWKDTCP